MPEQSSHGEARDCGGFWIKSKKGRVLRPQVHVNPIDKPGVQAASGRAHANLGPALDTQNQALEKPPCPMQHTHQTQGTG